MKAAAIAIALLVAAVGAIGVLSPPLLIDTVRPLLASGTLYAIGAVRVLFGTLLVWVASRSRMPRTLRVLGIVLIVAGLLTPFFGVARAEAIFGWWSNQSSWFMRAWSSLAVVFGVLVVFALGPRRDAA